MNVSFEGEPPPREFVKLDGGKLPMHLLPHTALTHIAAVLAFGAKKYTPDGWRTVDKRSRYYSAVLRHVMAWWGGERLDPESGLPHLAHAACSVLFLLEADELGFGVKDSPYPEKTTESK